MPKHSIACRKTKIFACYCIFGWLLACAAGTLHAEMRVIYPQQEKRMAQHTGYYFELLQVALELTKTKYGAYTLTYSEYAMNQARSELELSTKNGRIDISVFAWTPERDEKFYYVKIPIDRGLLGYRLLLIRSADQEKFNAVRTLEDLRHFRFGLLSFWSDVTVLRNNGLEVVAGNTFDGLFKMLDLGNFDAFSRDINEVQREFEENKKALPGLAIESGLLLHYPSARYFFVRKTPAGQQLSERLEAGLEMMKKDGSLDALFVKHRGNEIAKLKLNDRRVIELVNPILPPEAAAIPKNLLPPAKARAH